MKFLKNSKILIIGAGIAGLTIGRRLAMHGLQPTILESSGVIANGSTTRNEGWLHAGTYHSQSIADIDQAMRVAQRCIYGHDQYRQLCPEAIEDPLDSSIAITLMKNRIPAILERWKLANITYNEISLDELKRRSPQINTKNIEAAWNIRDVTINTRILCNRLAAEIKQFGGHIITNAEISKLEIANAAFSINGKSYTFQPEFIILSAGYQTNSIISKFVNAKLNLRYWKAHLLISNRIKGANIYQIDPYGVNMAHHREKTIIGMNTANLISNEPSLEVNHHSVDEMKTSLSKVLLNAHQLNLSPIACTKVDFAEDVESINLDISIFELSPNLYSVFPGKMTETPYLADVLTREILQKTNLSHIASRPMDILDN